jgi:GT2 family glycosyltransferase
MDITFALIIYCNSAKLERRLNKVVFPTIQYYKSKYNFEIILFDNSPNSISVLPYKFPVSFRYIWNQGINIYYGGAINTISEIAKGKFLVYICLNHGRMKCVTWLDDILAPLKNRKCGMAGCLQNSNLEFIGKTGQAKHIQGGVFAARIDLLRKFPYSSEYPHLYSDIWLCWRLEKAGYDLIHVPTISSVWRCNAPHENFKYMHDDIES